MPPVVTELIEHPHPGAPYGAKGVGEPPTISSTPAIVAAIRAATGKELNRVPVRLNGLHAPEMHEPGGPQARAWMVEHTRGQQITCRLIGERNRDRWIGVCEDRNGDLAAQLVAAGLGRDCPRCSGGRYARYETAAAARMPLPAYCVRR